MTVLSWLHLTDLHQGMTDQDWLWPTTRRALFDDLARVHDHAGPWDLVLFTGDLTQRGSADEFKRLEDTLGELWHHLDGLGSQPQLLAVPGNHDLVRPDPDDPHVLVLDDWTTKAKVRDAFWNPGSKYRELIHTAFAPYQAFWDRAAHRPAGVMPGLLPGDFSYVHEKAGARFGFLGLNSAFLQLTGADYERRLVIHPRQAQPAVGSDLDRWASSCHAAFLLTHHPPGWLYPEARDLLDGEILRPGRFTAHLFGHMHEARAHTLSEGGDAPRREWQGTSLFGLEWFGDPKQCERRHGYTAGRITLDGKTASIRQWPRRAERGQSRARHLGPDTSYRLDNDVANVDDLDDLRLPAPPLPTAAPVAAPAPRHPPRPRSHAWLAAALDCRLWERVPCGPDAERWRTAVERLVEACRAEWDAAGAALDDAWRDEELPGRVLRALDLLLVDSTASTALHPPEVALLVVAPFLREAAHASGVRWIAAGRPLSLDVAGDSTGPRAMLEREHKVQAPLVRRASRLAEQGREDDRRALALWLMHRCLARDPALWELEPNGHLPRALPDHVQDVGELAPAVRAAFVWQRLRELARCLFADPERIDRDDRDDRLRDEERIADGAWIREKLLGYALCLASWMAMDARRLPDVIVEHIGLSDRMTPADVHHALRAASWQPGPVGRALTVSCAHPAIDDALRRSVDRAMAVLDRIHRGTAERRARLDLLVGLPSRLTAEGVRARLDAEARPAYQTPHVRFELAHDEVKELLMGEQLYGDPPLAIRELYQNALDACRYREARRTYLERKGGARLEPWQGEIQFRQGEDGGRPYIECEDNGVGMGLPELEGCFAKAGRRFHDMPEFLEEQTEWLRVKPEVRLYPNSQFGVGVFSYFMLADEIEIETCRFNRDGSTGRTLRVHIAGSGSLFRVSAGKRGRQSGTRVRLYLGSTTYRQWGVAWPISCFGALNDVLHVAEYRTTCSESGRLLRVWSPGELSEAKSPGAVRLDEALWITNDQAGLLLVDGIKVDDRFPHCIVNLRRERQPRLSVDRRSVIAWDQHWIGDVLRRQWSKLVDWSPDFTTLWWLDASYPDVAVRLTDALLQRQVSLRSPYAEAPVRLDEVGCYAGDARLLEWATGNMHPRVRETSEREMDQLFDDERFGLREMPAFAAQRLERWMGLGAQIDPDALRVISTRMQGRVPPPATAAACIPQAADWFVLTKWRESPAGLAGCAASLGEPVGQTAERLLKYAPFGVSAPTFDAAEATFVPQPDDVIFLSRDADGQPPWLEGPPNLIHMLDVARALGRSVASVLAQYPRYEFLGIRALTISSEEFDAALPKDEADRLLLADARHNRAAGRCEIPFTLLVRTAATTRRPLGSLLDRLRAFETVGVTSTRLDFSPNADSQPDDLDVRDLEHLGAWDGSISLGHLLTAVVAAQDHHLFTTARRLGLLPAACSDDILAGLALDGVDASILSRDGDGTAPWIGRKVPRSHITTVAKALNLDETDLVRRVQRMAPLGVELLEEGELQVL